MGHTMSIGRTTMNPRSIGAPGMHHMLPALLIATAIAGALAGCRPPGSAPTVPAAGRLTYQGKPLANIDVVFTPTQGRRGSGTTDAQGRFQISTFARGDGAVPGRHRVTLWPAGPLSGQLDENPAARENAAEPQLPFPKRYSSPDSDLIVDLGDKGSRNAGACP
jgi:hypothetical protein